MPGSSAEVEKAAGLEDPEVKLRGRCRDAGQRQMSPGAAGNMRAEGPGVKLRGSCREAGQRQKELLGTCGLHGLSEVGKKQKDGRRLYGSAGGPS